MIRALALGADFCSSARGMMLSVGCIHAQQCNTNACPTGVATQNSKLMKGLDISDKSERVYHYHKNTIHAFLELMSATGTKLPEDIKRSSVMRMAEDGDVHTMDEIVNSWNIKKKVIDEIPVSTNLGNGNF